MSDLVKCNKCLEEKKISEFYLVRGEIRDKCCKLCDTKRRKGLSTDQTVTLRSYKKADSYNPQIFEEIKKLQSESFGPYTIGKKLGIHPQTIYSWIRKGLIR